MRKYAIASVTILALLGIATWAIKINTQHHPAQLVKTPQKVKKQPMPHTGPPLDVDKVFDLINQHRQSLDEQPLVRSDELDALAKQKCLDMQKYQYFAHKSPNLGYTPDALLKAHPRYHKAGENLIEVFTIDPSNPVERWLNSPEHKSNIEDRSFTVSGIYACSENTYWTRPTDLRYVVQEFAG